MCIICKMREAGASEEVLEMAETLAEFTVVSANGLARLKAEGALLNAEEELGLLAGQAMFAKRVTQETSDTPPEGLSPEAWQAMPPELRQLLQSAVAGGAKLQVINLSDIMPDESTTKH